MSDDPSLSPTRRPIVTDRARPRNAGWSGPDFMVRFGMRVRSQLDRDRLPIKGSRKSAFQIRADVEAIFKGGPVAAIIRPTHGSERDLKSAWGGLDLGTNRSFAKTRTARARDEEESAIDAH